MTHRGPCQPQTFCDSVKFANDIKLSGEVDTSEGRATLQQDLDRLEEQANKNVRKFYKDKLKVLHLGKHNPGARHRLGSTRLGSSSVEKNLGVLVDNKLNRRKWWIPQRWTLQIRLDRLLGHPA